MFARVVIPALALASAFAASPLHAQKSVEVVPFAGYMVFDDMLRGPLGSTLSNSNGAVVGAQFGLPLAGPVSLYGSGGFSRSDLTVGLPIVGGLSVGQTDAWMFDGGLELRAPGSRALSPLVQAGAGAVHYRISNSLIDTESTNAALALGAGVDMAITPAIGLRLMAKDYIGKFDFQEAVHANIEGRTTHNIGLIAGLRISM
jgi:opacity protein-like surface antigen